MAEPAAEETVKPIAFDLEQLHATWKNHWPLKGQSMLFIGNRRSREPCWLAQRGCVLVAVDPSSPKSARSEEAVHTATPSGVVVRWLEDILPELDTCRQLNRQFHQILISLASWDLVAASQKERALRKLSNMLLPGGTLIFAYCTDAELAVREPTPFALDSLNQQAKRLGLQWQVITGLPDSHHPIPTLFQLPDDGSGALAHIRHIAVNDSKSSTYKLALLRTLVRIADAHPGAIKDRNDDQVAISLGLVAYYWVRLFKRLLDAGLQQNSDSNKGIGFVKEDGWNQLKHLKADDLVIGALFAGDEAEAIQALFRDTITTIQAGPAQFIYQGSKENRLFTIEKQRRTKSSCILLDKTFFDSFGDFILSEKLWHCLRVYGCWIEPLLVQQWIGEMQKYKRNRESNITLDRYYQTLSWLERDRDTLFVRRRIETLRQQGIQIESVWSGRKAPSFDVDHCLPFAYWPNNDLWNLLPSTPNENRSKSNRVPSQARLSAAKCRIIDWWKLAWSEGANRQRFFIEAHLSLPNVSSSHQDFEIICEAMQDQIIGVQQRLQVGEW